MNFSTSDITAPTLVSYELSSYEIDLSQGDYVIDVQARITDDISGVSDGQYSSGVFRGTSQARWRSPSGNQFLDAGYFTQPSSGTYLDGIYLGQTILNKNSEAGTWKLEYVQLYDESGNTNQLSKNDLDELGIRTTFEVSPLYVYRLRNDNSGKYLFSSNQGEIDTITGAGWTNEGIAYKSPGSDEGTSALHRFHTNGNGHFYTANEYEKKILESTTSWTYEGIAFQVFSHEQASFVTGSIPVIRYLNANSGIHLYSTSSFEQDILNSAPEWIYEGVAWYGEGL